MIGKLFHRLGFRGRTTNAEIEPAIETEPMAPADTPSQSDDDGATSPVQAGVHGQTGESDPFSYSIHDMARLSRQAANLFTNFSYVSEWNSPDAAFLRAHVRRKDLEPCSAETDFFISNDRNIAAFTEYFFRSEKYFIHDLSSVEEWEWSLFLIEALEYSKVWLRSVEWVNNDSRRRSIPDLLPAAWAEVRFCPKIPGVNLPRGVPREIYEEPETTMPLVVINTDPEIFYCPAENIVAVSFDRKWPVPAYSLAEEQRRAEEARRRENMTYLEYVEELLRPWGPVAPDTDPVTPDAAELNTSSPIGYSRNDGIPPEDPVSLEVSPVEDAVAPAVVPLRSPDGNWIRAWKTPGNDLACILAALWFYTRGVEYQGDPTLYLDCLGPGTRDLLLAEVKARRLNAGRFRAWPRDGVIRPELLMRFAEIDERRGTMRLTGEALDVVRFLIEPET